MTTKYYKSDFALTLILTDAKDNEFFVGGNDFSAMFRTPESPHYFVASQKNEELTNCSIGEDGRLNVIFKDHHLGAGRLSCEFAITLDDSAFPDGERLEVNPLPLDFALTTQKGTADLDAEIAVSLPVVKISFSDLTEDEINVFTEAVIEHIEPTITEKVDAITSDAKAAVTKANDAATEATTAANNATKAVQSVNEAIDKAEEATKKANTAADAANSASDFLSSNFESIGAYGIEFSTQSSSPTCTRIGNRTLHATLPIQSRIRGCLLDDNGNVVKYLDANDWTNETRDGSLGQVMVEIPDYYRKFKTIDSARQVWLSEYPIDGYHYVPKKYVSAYEATLQRSKEKLSSVVNESEDYYGGRVSGSDFSMAGMPIQLFATEWRRGDIRKYARNRGAVGKNGCGWNCMTYDIHKDLYWLFVVEYATLNSQADFTAELTSEGFRQGGLGEGVTTFSSSEWYSYNALHPFIPCGTTDSLGNNSGIVDYTITTGKIFKVPRYRGVENPFGHLDEIMDGLNILYSPSASNGGDGTTKAYVCNDCALFAGTVDNYKYIGDMSRTTGYIKDVFFGEEGHIVASLLGGSSSTYYCDRWLTESFTDVRICPIIMGGDALGKYAGFLSSCYGSSPIASTRLTFYPEAS